ncbi:MAG: hypothetical protein ACREBU_07580 [Nitrososphaera sp.]
MASEAFLSPESSFKMSGKPAHLNGKTRTTLDFWQWAYSDLMQNITRGYVAQYIVAWALGIDDKPTVPWLPFDLVLHDGRKIEVKSTAYLQAWKQPDKILPPRFVLSPRLAWSDEEGLAKAATWNADVYVLCYFHSTNLKTADIMDLDQWKFWVFDKKELITMLNSRKTLTVQRLEKEGHKPVTAFGLRSAIMG